MRERVFDKESTTAEIKTTVSSLRGTESRLWLNSKSRVLNGKDNYQFDDSLMIEISGAGELPVLRVMSNNSTCNGKSGIGALCYGDCGAIAITKEQAVLLNKYLSDFYKLK